MKPSTALLQLVAVATSIMGTPIVVSPQNLFKIQVVSDNNIINNKFLSIVNDTVNIQRGGYTPLQVVLDDSDIRSQVTLKFAPVHTTDSARAEQVLALQGEPGLQPLVKTDMSGSTEAYSFFIDASMIKDDFNGGRWLAFPPVGKTDGWTVSWYDGNVPIIQDFYPIQLRISQVRSEPV